MKGEKLQVVRGSGVAGREARPEQSSATAASKSTWAADERKMNADRSLFFDPRSSVFISGYDVFTRSDGRGSESERTPAARSPAVLDILLFSPLDRSYSANV